MRTTTENELFHSGYLATQVLKKHLTSSEDVCVDTWGQFKSKTEISEAESAIQVYKKALVALGEEIEVFDEPNNNTWTFFINNPLAKEDGSCSCHKDAGFLSTIIVPTKGCNDCNEDSFQPIKTAEAVAFAEKEGLSDYIDRAISIIKQSFSKVNDIEVVYEVDPEANESWISLEATINGEMDQIFDEYQNYTKKVNKEIPWPQIGLIRFSYNIV